LTFDKEDIKSFTQEKMFSVLGNIEKDIQHLRKGKIALKDGLVKNKQQRFYDLTVHASR